MKLMELFDEPITKVSFTRFKGMAEHRFIVNDVQYIIVIDDAERDNLGGTVYKELGLSKDERQGGRFISFMSYESGDSLSGANVPIKVFSKVASAIKSFFSENTVTSIVFGYRNHEAKRDSVYTGFVKLFERHGFRLIKKQEIASMDVTCFYLKKD